MMISLLSLSLSQYRYDPYEDPDQMPRRKPKQTKLREGFAPRETASSDIYETPTQPRRKNADTNNYEEGDLPEMVRYEKCNILIV